MFHKKHFCAKLIGCIVLLSLFTVISAVAFAAGQYMWPVPGHTIINGCSTKGYLALDINSPTPIAYAEVVATKSGTVLMTYTGCHNYNARVTHVSCSSATCSPNGNIDQEYVVNGHTIHVCNYGSGNGVVLKHDDGTYSRYAHLMDTSQYPVVVSIGQHVEQGQLLGYVGQTGNAKGFHLHFEISSGISHSAGSKYYNTTPLIDAKTVEYIYEAPTSTSVLDVNGELNGGIYSGNTEGMGTFDVYINNSLEADDVTDFWKEIPQGYNYTITDFKSTNLNDYSYIGESSYSGIIGESDINVYLHFVTPHVFDVNGQWNDIEMGDTVGGCTFDVYINDVLMADGWSDYYGTFNWGSTYRITDIQSLNPEGYDYVGQAEYSGTIYDDTKIILPFATAKRYLDVNGLFNNEQRYDVNGVGTFDIYFDDELVENDISDYNTAWPIGTRYTITDIRPTNDGWFAYIGEESYTGVIGQDNTYIDLEFVSFYELNVNGRWEDTETDDVVGGCTLDVYIDGVLVADGWSDYYAWHKYGSTYRIENIELLNPEGYDYAGEQSYSGTITDTTKIVLPFVTAQREVDLNALLDGEDRGWLDGIATADVHVNGELIWDDTSDYVAALPYGAEYLVNDIKLISDKYIYIGPSSFSGTVGMDRIDVRLLFKTAVRLELPENTQVVRSKAFMNVPASLIVLPAQATTIESLAFANCSSLERIIIPDGVTSIAPDAFEGCEGFTIVCPPGSYAESFAKDNSISFAELRAY